MKTKTLLVLSCLILVVIVVLLIFSKDKPVSFITLDINPSIEIGLTRDEKIMTIKALNEDAKEIIDNNLKGKDLDYAIRVLVDNLIINGYINSDEHVEVLMYSKGEIVSGEVQEKIQTAFLEKEIDINIVVIETVTKEDIELSKKYNISISKAAYINSIVEEKDIDLDLLVDKPFKELKETKETGRYCKEGYTLEGDFCTKETGRETARQGDVCKEGYYDYKGKCYEEVRSLEKDNYICHDNFKLEGNMCTRTQTQEAKANNYKCESGTLVKKGELYNAPKESGDYNDMICYDEKKAQKPTLRCLAQEHIIVNGKCGMGPKPLLPTATGCTPEDVNINGGCYDFNTDNEWVCPNSGIYDTEDMICPETISYTKAIGIDYYCEDGYTLEEDKCILEEKEPARKERYCPSGYTLTEEERCINKEKTTEYINGYICDKENTRIEGNVCIILDIEEALHN